MYTCFACITNVDNVLIHEQMFDEILCINQYTSDVFLHRSVYLGRFLADLTPVIMIVQAFGHFDVFLVLKPSCVLSNLLKV